MNNTRRKEIQKIADDTRSLAKISTLGVNDIFDACSTMDIYYLRYPLKEDDVQGAVIKKV